MYHILKVTNRLIQTMVWDPENKEHLHFDKLDIKDGIWIIVVAETWEKNFPHNLPYRKYQEIIIVLPISLQMGWNHLQDFFCT